MVALGATAARRCSAAPVPVTRERGRKIALPSGLPALITVHPSFLLRLPDAAARALEQERFVADLRAVARLVPAIRRAA